MNKYELGKYVVFHEPGTQIEVKGFIYNIEYENEGVVLTLIDRINHKEIRSRVTIPKTPVYEK